MDRTTENSDKTIRSWRDAPSREERFRTPLHDERAVGLWVDRIGQSVASAQVGRLRLIGMYAAVRVDAGRGWFFSDTTGAIAVAAGDTMLLFPDEPSQYWADGVWSTRWIVWNGPDAEILEQLGYIDRTTPVAHDEHNVVPTAYQQIEQLMGSEERGAILERKTILLHLVLQVYRARSRSQLRRTHADAIDQAIWYVQQHYDQQLPIDSVARRFNFSTTHFRRLFRQRTGRSPRQFVTAERISRSKELLARGVPIKDVAARVGYDDVAYFMRVFRQVVGMPPGHFARTHA